MFQKSDKKNISSLYASKCPNTSILHKALLSKSRFYFFFLILCHAKTPPSIGMAHYWYPSFNDHFLKFFAFFKFNMSTQKSD